MEVGHAAFDAEERSGVWQARFGVPRDLDSWAAFLDGVKARLRLNSISRVVSGGQAPATPSISRPDPCLAPPLGPRRRAQVLSSLEDLLHRDELTIYSDDVQDAAQADGDVLKSVAPRTDAAAPQSAV